MIWFDTLAQGMLLGGLYALFAAGLSLVFGIMRLINLAHGDLIVLAAYLILGIATALHLNPFIAALIALPVMFALGWLLQAHLLNRVLGEDILLPLLVTFGLSVVIQNALLEGFSADSRKLSAGAIEAQSLPIGPVSVGVMPLITLVSAVAVIFLLNQLFYRTRLGRAFRATSDDAVTVQLMGIRPDTMQAIAWGIAACATGLAGALIANVFYIVPTVGETLGIVAFVTVSLGGFGSVPGALVAGLLIGVIESLSGYLIGAVYKDMVVYTLFLGFLWFRPQGLMGKM